jgi:hypothetical protein
VKGRGDKKMPTLELTTDEVQALLDALGWLDYLDDETYYEVSKKYIVEILDEDGNLDDEETPILDSLYAKVRAL